MSKFRNLAMIIAWDVLLIPVWKVDINQGFVGAFSSGTRLILLRRCGSLCYATHARAGMSVTFVMPMLS